MSLSSLLPAAAAAAPPPPPPPPLPVVASFGRRCPATNAEAHADPASVAQAFAGRGGVPIEASHRRRALRVSTTLCSSCGDSASSGTLAPALGSSPPSSPPSSSPPPGSGVGKSARKRSTRSGSGGLPDGSKERERMTARRPTITPRSLMMTLLESNRSWTAPVASSMESPEIGSRRAGPGPPPAPSPSPASSPPVRLDSAQVTDDSTAASVRGLIPRMHSLLNIPLISSSNTPASPSIAKI
mmetsp:Transcript_43536/g.132485  ORF Transcript_43536/g.132485 Transcript_43536/m.132485 type:complete len:242 (-) Transcript_43536:806-1531(-)